MKWFAAGTIALFALLLLLWMQLREPATAVAAPPKTVVAATAEARASASFAEASKKLAAEAAAVPEGKIDPASDAFTYAFDEMVPPKLTMNAAKCYTGGLHRVDRNAKVKLAYSLDVKGGEVTVHDLKVVESTIDDPALVACFVKEVVNTHWHDDRLPDWKQQDELVIRPERGMKKFTKENMDYVPDGPSEVMKVQPPDQPSSREMPKYQPKF